MSDATFQTFLTSGLFVLIAAIGYMAWTGWRFMDRLKDAEKLSLEGIGHELDANLKRMITELAGVANGTIQNEIELVPVVHSQIDSFLGRPTEVDRKSLTMMRANYNALSAHKGSIRSALSQQADPSPAANFAADAVISSIATLYLWSEHKGATPEAARSTRSWHVRDWMKANKYKSDLLPGLHLRDAVVERLRQLGMTLTPQPLTHTASEFYAMQYDRKADPNAPFWKRKPKPVPVVTPEALSEAPPEPASEPEPMPEPEISAEPAPVPEQAPEPELVAEPATIETTEPVEAEPESGADVDPEDKPPSSGSMH